MVAETLSSGGATLALLVSWIATYLIHSTVFLGGAWILTRIDRPSARRREIVWRAALLAPLATASLVTLCALRPVTGRLEIALGEDSPVRAIAPRFHEEAPLRSHALERGRASSSADGQLADRTPSQSATPPSETRSPRALAIFSLARTLVVSWLVIGAALWVWFLLAHGWLRFRLRHRREIRNQRLRSMLESLCQESGIRGRVGLSASTLIASPIACARMEICLPEAALTELEAAEQRALLAHELAHLVRRDPLWLFAMGSIERWLWLQPLNRVAARSLRDLAELRSDDWARAQLDGDGLSLAICLAEVAQWISRGARRGAMVAALPSVAGMARASSLLVHRVERLVEAASETFDRRRSRLVSSIGLALLIAAGLAAPSVRSSIGRRERSLDVARLSASAWLVVDPDHRALHVPSDVALSLDGEGPLAVRDGGKTIEVPSEWSVLIDGQRVSERREILGGERIELTDGSGDVRWTLRRRTLDACVAESQTAPPSESELAAPSAPSLGATFSAVAVSDDEVEVRDGVLARATHQGRPIPRERRLVSGSSVRFFDEGGWELGRVELDPRRLGFQFETAGERRLVRAEDPAGKFTVELEGNRVTAVTFDGRALPHDQWRQEPGRLLVLARDGSIELDLRLEARGGFSWTPRSRRVAMR